MKKMGKSMLSLLLIGLCIWVGMRLADKKILSDGVIRLHVVAASDSQSDQQCKLLVRDAILQEMEALGAVRDAGEMKTTLLADISRLEDRANQVLAQAGCSDTVTITLEKEKFPTKEYDTFRLPAGVYESLRVTIGRGQGENWWCVVYPDLCHRPSPEDVRDTASGAGFPNSLAGAITGEAGLSADFFFLDGLGRLENLFYPA